MINKKSTYYYDEKSLSFKEIKSQEIWGLASFKYLISSLFIASIISFMFISIVDSPKEKKLKREISNLELQYKSMQKQIYNKFIIYCVYYFISICFNC